MERLVNFVPACDNVVVTHCQEVAPAVQRGPMCGLVALTMAAELLLQGEGGPLDTSPTITDERHPENILEYARQNHLSKQGEVFSSETLADVSVNHLHMQARVVRMDAAGDALRALLAGVISGRGAVVVPYDADKDHTPCLAKGHRAHWCLLVGLCLLLKEPELPGYASVPLTLRLLKCCHPTRNNPVHHTLKEGHVEEFSKILTKSLDSQSMLDILKGDWIYVFARQGKSAHLGLWNLRNLVESNANLMEVEPKRSNPLEYVIPEGGLKEGLQNKVVFITKS